MSTIGSTASFNVAGSIVGSSQPDAATDRLKAASAEQKARVDQNDLSAQALDDVADPEFGSDRDADGRQLYRAPNSPRRPDGQIAQDQPEQPPPADAFGESGNALDLQA